MPTPALGSGPAYEAPPQEIMEISPKLYDYLYMLHIRLFGSSGAAGDLDTANINVGGLTTINHNNLTNVTSYQHHGAGSHSGLDKSAASSNPSASTVSVTSADATDLATVIALANEIKGDVNTLVTDVNAIVTNLTDLKTKMRTANLLTT